MRQTRLLRWIRWTTGALLLPVISMPIIAAAQTRQLKLVSTPWAPFTNAPGQPRYALDLVGAALKRVGIGAETVIVDEDSLAPSLLSGDFDGGAALWKDSARERVLIYSQPYLENRLILVGRQGSDVSAKSLADLAGKRVALVAGYAYGEAVGTRDGPIFVGSHSKEESVAKLLNGEADYTLMDDLVIQYLVSHHEEEVQKRLAFGSTPLITRSLHLAVSRSLPDAESIISRFNTVVVDMMVDGTYHRLLHLDWIHADVDGDGLREIVPHDDQIGPDEPERPYALFLATGTASAEPEEKPRFYLGGKIYERWSTVPARYKAPDYSRSGPGALVQAARSRKSSTRTSGGCRSKSSGRSPKVTPAHATPAFRAVSTSTALSPTISDWPGPNPSSLMISRRP